MKGQDANFLRFTTHALLPIFPEESWVREWIRIRVDVEIFESGKLFEFRNFWLEYWLILFGSGSFRTWALKVKFLPSQLIWIYFVTNVVLYKVNEIWNVKILISCLHTNFSNRMLADQLQAFFGELVTTTMCMLSLVWSWKVSFSERHFTDLKPFVIKLRNSRLERKISFREAKTRHLFDFNGNRTGTLVDHGARKSNNWLDQWQSGKLGTGSRV